MIYRKLATLVKQRYVWHLSDFNHDVKFIGLNVVLANNNIDVV